MIRATVAFLLGVVLFQQRAELPDTQWLWVLPLLLAFARRWSAARPLAWLAAGLAWSWLVAWSILQHGLPPELEGRDVTVEGYVASLPTVHDRQTNFLFDIERLSDNGRAWPSPGRVQLAWYQDVPTLEAGTRWRLVVRLKQPHGFMNPGGFDFEGWLYRQHIRATGYVREEGDHRLLENDPWSYPVQRLRQRIEQAMQQVLGPDRPMAPILIALAIGEQKAISDTQWDVFTRTGITHLIAISGLHISMVGALVYAVVRRLWPWSAWLALRWPAQKAAAIAGFLATAGYCALAGFAIPSQRSLIMIGVVMWAVLRQRFTKPADTLATALLAVLVFDPLAVMDAGFWLSFASVALIFYGMGGRLAPQGLWWHWGRVHALIAIGLTPALLVLFQRVSLISPLANLFAVPWISFVVTPLTLVGALFVLPFPALGGAVLQLADLTLDWIWHPLVWLSQLDWALWSQHVPLMWTLAPALAGVVMLLMPQGMPGRWLGAVLALPMFLTLPPRPQAGEAWFTLLDVGQGLASVVSTAHHTLVYDTGPRFSERFDTGEAVAAPFLRAQGVTHVDMLVVSHGDNDHIGGTRSLLAQVPVGRVLTSVPDKIPSTTAPIEPCAAGQHWEWDGVRFEMEHPPRDGLGRRNDSSCVLRVTSGASILMPGDIEKGAERELVESLGTRLATDILVAPHHGSNTSSTDPFIAMVSPRYVLFPVGYRNRFGFPKPAVVERYRQMRASLYDSAHHGAICFHLGPGMLIPLPETWRQAGRHYWHQP